MQNGKKQNGSRMEKRRMDLGWKKSRMDLGWKKKQNRSRMEKKADQ